MSGILTCLFPLFACIVLGVIYVASLYIWNSPHNRDHPLTIKRRFLSVLCMTFISPLFLWLCLTDDDLSRAPLPLQMGLRLPGLLQAIFASLLLTMVLFLGPIVMHIMSGMFHLYTEPMYWWNNLCDLIWVRNHIVAPLSEEFTFRACMMPLLLTCLPTQQAIVICPLLFGVAHCHHMIEKLRSGWPLSTALVVSIFQFAYTSVFGAYSAFLFARTGHFAAPLVAHAFCNHMGLPNLAEVARFPMKQRIVISSLFVLGVLLWYLLLFPITTPSFYSNDIHWRDLS